MNYLSPETHGARDGTPFTIAMVVAGGLNIISCEGFSYSIQDSKAKPFAYPCEKSTSIRYTAHHSTLPLLLCLQLPRLRSIGPPYTFDYSKWKSEPHCLCIFTSSSSRVILSKDKKLTLLLCPRPNTVCLFLKRFENCFNRSFDS